MQSENRQLLAFGTSDYIRLRQYLEQTQLKRVRVIMTGKKVKVMGSYKKGFLGCEAQDVEKLIRDLEERIRYKEKLIEMRNRDAQYPN